MKKEQSTSVLCVPTLLPKIRQKKTALKAIGEGLSVRQHTAIVASVIANSGGDVSDFTLSSSTAFKVAKEVVTKGGEKIIQHNTDLVKSSLLPIIPHFDGKIVKELTNGKDFLGFLILTLTLEKHRKIQL